MTLTLLFLFSHGNDINNIYRVSKLQSINHICPVVFFCMSLELFLKHCKIKIIFKRHNIWPEKPKIITVWPLRKKPADPWLIISIYCVSVHQAQCVHCILILTTGWFFKWENWNLEFLSLNDPLIGGKTQKIHRFLFYYKACAFFHFTSQSKLCSFWLEGLWVKESGL